MSWTSDHIESKLRTGADGVIDTLCGMTDRVVIASKSLSEGYRITSGTQDSVEVLDAGDAALSNAIGMAMTGMSVGIVIEADSFKGLRELLQSALLRQLGLTVIIAHRSEAVFDPIAEFGDIGCPVLCASGPQALVDLAVVSAAVAKAAMIPVLVTAGAEQSLWTYQRLIDPPALDELVRPESLGFYLSELQGGATGDVAWIDPANPMASGITTPADLRVKRTIGREVFVAKENAGLLDSAMQLFSKKSGRSYSAAGANTSRSSEVVLLYAGTAEDAIFQAAGTSKKDPSIVRVTRLRPFPTAKLEELLSDARHVGVFCEANSSNGKASSILAEVRAVLYRHESNDHRGFWGRHSDDGSKARTVVPIYHARGWEPAGADLAAIAGRVRNCGVEAGPLVAGVQLTAEGVTLPAIEEDAQRMARAGLSFSEFEVRTTDDDAGSPHFYVYAKSVHAMWPWIQRICGLLESAGIEGVRGRLHSQSQASSSPVAGCVSYDARFDAPDVVICPDPQLLHTVVAREILPANAIVVTRESDSEKWPFWMVEKRLNIVAVPAEHTAFSADDMLLAALVATHPLLSRAAGEIFEEAEWFSTDDRAGLAHVKGLIHPADAGDFEEAGRRPPEPEPPAELLDRPMASLPAASLHACWKSTGQLYREGRLSEAPVDARLVSHYVPASTSSIARAAQIRPQMPAVIPERCTGCGSCWTVCPEAAVVVRPFSVEALWNAAVQSSGRSFVHLPRLAPAVIKAAHRLTRDDELHQFLTAEQLFAEAFARVLDKAGVEGEKRMAVEDELDSLLTSISSIRPVRTEAWFDRKESVVRGEGALLGIGIDPDACTSCGLCVASCSDEAMEYVDGGLHLSEWQQLAAMSALPGESEPAKVFDHPTAPLVGRTSRRVMRAGSADTANLNRTVLRLFLEAQREHADDIAAQMLDDIDGVITRIDEWLQKKIDESVRVNDFDRFSRELTDVSRQLTDHLTELFENDGRDGNDRLSRLTSSRARLQEVRSRLSSDKDERAPMHMVLIDATEKRSLGLASYPMNPFSIPYYRSSSEDVATLILGIKRGFRERYLDVARELRVARQSLDDVLERGAGEDYKPEDFEWAESMMPLLVLVTDRIDVAALDTIRVGTQVRILALTGAGPFDSGFDLSVLAPMYENAWIARLTIRDPVALLADLLQGSSGKSPVMAQVYAPDAVRDGLDADEALQAAVLAERSGVVLPFKKEPGCAVEWKSAADETVSAADWMVTQDRFAHLFDVIPRADWASNQSPVAEWLHLSMDERNSVQPYVEYAGRRYGLHDEAMGYALIVKAASKSKPIPPRRQEKETPAEPPAMPPAKPDTKTASLQQLTMRLLEMSGFAGAEESLAAWRAGQDEAPEE